MKEKVGAATMVRLRDGVAAKIDAVAGKGQRAAFIREAVDEKLRRGRKEPMGPTVTAAEPVVPSNIKIADTASDDRPDFRVLLTHLRKGAKTEREAARDLGWPEMKVAKAAQGLSAADLIRYEHGAMVVA